MTELLTFERPRLRPCDLVNDCGVQTRTSLKIDEVAELLDVCKSTVYKFIRTNQLRAVKAPRYRVTVTEVFRYLELDCYGRPMRPGGDRSPDRNSFTQRTRRSRQRPALLERRSAVR